MCQLSVSYSLLLLCHLLACRILPCHHLHCIIMFSKLVSVPVSLFSPLSVLSPHTLARARGTSEILFYKWPENVLGMGRELACDVVLLSVGRLPNFIAFGVRLTPQRINIAAF